VDFHKGLVKGPFFKKGVFYTFFFKGKARKEVLAGINWLVRKFGPSFLGLHGLHLGNIFVQFLEQGGRLGFYYYLRGLNLPFKNPPSKGVI